MRGVAERPRSTARHRRRLPRVPGLRAEHGDAPRLAVQPRAGSCSSWPWAAIVR